MSGTEALLDVRKLVKHFEVGSGMFGGRRALVRAVDGVSFSIRRGETLGLVGESGCGKTTLGRTLLGIQPETSGEILLDGQVVSDMPPQPARLARRAVQYVHQDAGAALDPWWSIGRILEEGLIVHGHSDARARQVKIGAILDAVGLDGSFRPRYVHELSGGQLRRVALARILLLEPRIVILDEPTSGLDLSVQATVLSLIADLKARLGLTYLLISHDLSVVERMCDRVAIMYLGRIVEIGPTARIFAAPAHPYTRALLAAAPRLAPGSLDLTPALPGDPPSPAAVPSGCAFRTRCAHAAPQCAGARPSLAPVAHDQDHQAACLRLGEI